MGSGKTTVGKALAHQLGWRFLDLDDEVERRAGKPIARIFAEDGEPAFRRAELSALTALSLDEPVVVALGGGTFVQEQAKDVLHRIGEPVVFLDLSLDELLARCRAHQHDRPMFRDTNQFRHLHELRRPHYMRADLRIDAEGKSVEVLVSEITSQLGLSAQEQP
jgi:shikimate kinase